MSWPTPLEDVYAQATPNVTMAPQVSTILVSVELKKITYGGVILVTYTGELHQDPANAGTLIFQLATDKAYPNAAMATWGVGIANAVSGQNTPVELRGDWVLANKGYSGAGSILVEVTSISGPGPWKLSLYGFSGTAASIGYYGELRARVY